MQSLNLIRDATTMSGIYFSGSMNLMNQKNYCQAITNIHSILKLWKIRNLSIEGKTQFLRQQLSPNQSIWYFLLFFLIILLTKQQKCKNLFYGMIHPLKLNTKNETLKMEFKAGGLNNVDIRFKFASLQCSWIKNPNDDCSHVQDFTVQNLCLILLLVFLHISYIREILQAGQTTIVYCMFVLVVFSYHKYSIITMLNKIENIVLKYQTSDQAFC